MSKKMIIGLLSFMIFATTTYAAGVEPMNKVEAEMRATKDYSKQIETMENFKKKYDASNADITKMTPDEKREFGRAVKSFVAQVPGLEENGLMRLILETPVDKDGKRIEKPSSERVKKFVANVLRLKSGLEASSPEVREASALQIRLLNLTGIRLNAKNMGTSEFKALKTLLSLDLISLPNAVPVVRRIVDKLKEGKSVEEAVKFGMADMKEKNIDKFNEICGPEAEALLKT